MYRQAVHGGFMSDTVTELKPANPKAGEWAERIAAQQRGDNRKAVLQGSRVDGALLYAWRKTRRKQPYDLLW